MKFNSLKLIALTLSSGLFISSIPTKAESFETNYKFLNKNSSNNTLIAETPIYRVIKKAIVRKNGYLKLKLVNPIESVSGSVIVNSPSGAYEYLVKDAAISKKSITWRGGAEKVFSNKTALRIDTSKLTGIKFTGNTIPAASINTKVLGFTSDSGALASSYGGVAGSAAVGGSAAAVVAPAVVAGVSAAAILGGVVAAGVAIGASSSSGSGNNTSN